MELDLFNNIVWAAIMAPSGYGVFKRHGYPPLIGAGIGFLMGLFLGFFSLFAVGIFEWLVGRTKPQQQDPAEPYPASDQAPMPDYGTPSAPIPRDDDDLPAPLSASDVQRRLAEIESYYQQGIITQKEYNEMRRAARSGKG